MLVQAPRFKNLFRFNFLQDDQRPKMTFKETFKIRVVFPIPVFPMIYTWSLLSFFLNPKVLPSPLKFVLAKRFIFDMDFKVTRCEVMVTKREKIERWGLEISTCVFG